MVETSNKRESKPVIPPKKEARHPHGSGQTTQTGRKAASPVAHQPKARAATTSSTIAS
jgi:hypothetical protein